MHNYFGKLLIEGGLLFIFKRKIKCVKLRRIRIIAYFHVSIYVYIFVSQDKERCEF